MTIRPMRREDIPEVGRIWLAASIEAHDFVPADFWRSDVATMTGEILPHPDTRGFVFESDRAIEGFATLGGRRLACLFVRPGRQGRGVGAALLRHVQALHPELTLTVYKQNPRAVRFYEREGFRVTGEGTCPHTGCPELTMAWARGPGEAAVRAAVRERYRGVARTALGAFAYPTGAEGARALGYDDADIAAAPESARRSFCGVGNPFALGPAGRDDAVLDVGCGAGFDLFLAAARARRAAGVDLTPAMVRRARANVPRALVVLGGSESLPFADGAFDLVLSNGVLNLSANKPRSFAEAFRVLRPGGRLQVADIVLQEALPPEVAADPGAWAG